MDDIKKDVLLKIAAHVRAAVTVWTENNVDICQDDLGGACAIASFALWKVLLACNYKADFVVRYARDSGGHCWVEIDSYVIDITATQFNGPEIAFFHTEEIPDWFPDDLLFPLYDVEEEPVVEEYIGANGVHHVTDWGKQSALLYESHVATLVEQFKRGEITCC